ncbi:uncharacterized protein LOC132717419 [Ruditapes philippinarum]|uniref:uncharacterized protein LOC132717419 n=1 Tax=Ruditapes philippinarum TaxID=129788 RepID=UPI00295BCF0B|nr:uncharacterized protein LOC132717419 [Ruditapes philippinarum]
MFPTEYSNAKTVNRRNGSQLWTRMFKTNIVYKYDSYIPDLNHRILCDDGKNEKSTRSTKSLSSTETVTTIPLNVSSTTININGQSPFSEYIIIGVCVSLVLLSLIIVSLACFCWQRIVPNVSSQAYYISPTYSTRINENNVTVTDNDHRDVQDENSDLTSQHYYATPTEIHYEQNQELQSFRNATREVNQKEDHDTEELTNTGAYESLQEHNKEMHNYEMPTNVAYQTGAYESLQEDNTEMHNYETPTNAAYQTVDESMIDDHEYSMLQN